MNTLFCSGSPSIRALTPASVPAIAAVPVGLRRLARHPGEVPALAGIDHIDREATLVQRAVHPAVHPPRRLHDHPRDRAPPEPVAESADARPVIAELPVRAIHMNIQCCPAYIVSVRCFRL